ncbi:MAG: hypothetical protein ABF735_12855 [Lentilactobacillus hilgardii]
MVKATYRSQSRGSMHTAEFYERREADPKWAADYQAVREQIKQERLNTFLFIIFLMAGIELAAIIGIIIYRLLNNETPLQPGCYLDLFLREIFGL